MKILKYFIAEVSMFKMWALYFAVVAEKSVPVLLPKEDTLVDAGEQQMHNDIEECFNFNVS